MKNTLKNIITIGAMASFALAPFAALANDGISVNTDIKKSATFCEMIKSKSVDDFRNLGNRSDKMDENRNERDGAIAALRAKIDGKRDDNQGDRQAKFDALIASWESNAKNDAEKSAIAEFKVSLAAAMSARVDGINGAATTARSETDAARIAARAKIDAALSDLQTKITAALTKAQTDCANGVSSATVRINFAADTKAALDAFKLTRTDVHTETKTDIKVIHDERKSEMQQTRAGFKGFIQSFRDRMRSMFSAKTQVQ